MDKFEFKQQIAIAVAGTMAGDRSADAHQIAERAKAVADAVSDMLMPTDRKPPPIPIPMPKRVSKPPRPV